MKTHQTNTAHNLLTQSDKLLHDNSYYPFGMQMSGLDYSTGTSPENKYLYNGKELQDDFELDWYDYGARMYDAQIGRWHVVDPMAEEREWLSPYNFCSLDPINRTDPTGALDDHWEIDNNGNARLLDAEGDEIFVNNKLITQYNFNTPKKLNALSTIGSYYYSQNSGSTYLFNDKVSILSYEDYKVTGSINWNLDSKPFNHQMTPLAFAYSKKQYGLAADRIVLTVDDGYISGYLSTKWNLRSVFTHEDAHLGQPLDNYDYNTYATYFELDAYKAQMQNITWGKTTSAFQKYMLNNTKDYLNQLKGSNDPRIEKRYQEYLIFFNSEQ